MAQISLWTQSLIKGENIWKKEKENHTVPHARTHARTHALPFLLGICLLCTQLLTVHAANNPTATGESGTNGSGGGGGVVGGVAGEAILHSHVDACYKDLSYTPQFGNWQYHVWGSSCFDSTNTNSYQYNGHTTDDFDYSTCVVRIGWSRECHIVENRANWWNTSGYDGIPTNGNTTMHLSYQCNGWGALGGNICNTNWMPEESEPSKFVILNQDGTIIAQGLFRDYPYYAVGGGGDPSTSDFRQSLNITLPKGTTKVFIHLLFHLSGNCWFTAGLTSLSFSGASEKICAYNEGDVERSKASFGGTSDASVTDTINKTVLNTTQKDITGNGIFQIHVVNENLLNGIDNTTYLNNAAIRDMEIPDAVGNVTMSDAANTRTVTWETPISNGTEYEFKAQTYAVDFDSPTGTTLVMDTELNGTDQELHSHTHQGDIVYVDGVSMATESGGCYTVPYATQKAIPHAVSVERKFFTTYDGGISCYTVTAKCSVHDLFRIPNTPYNDDLGAHVMNFWTKNDTGSMGWWNGLTWNQTIDQIECPYDHIENVTYYKLNH